ncbi:hypothetical protein EP7_000113 [Isosphaeraceae bacterium EP7]
MGNPEVSQRRIDANRRNALRSTGPRSAEGKAKARRNSLIHGLAGDGVVVPDAEGKAIQERADQWNSSLRPTNAFEMGLVETIAIESIRIDRCRVEERLVRDFRARRAQACWGDERKAEIARLGRSLAARPEEISAKLGTTSPGCDWMIARWRMLGHALDKTGTWTDAQASMALDLLGIAPELRDLASPIDPEDGYDTVGHRQELVDDELERLQARKEWTLDEIEDEHREAAIRGLNTVDDPTLVLLRRYETASLRRMKWALDLMHKSDKTRPVDHGFGKRDFDPPAWKGPNPAAVPNFPTPRAMPPAPPAAGAERTHLDGILNARISEALPRVIPPTTPPAPQSFAGPRNESGPQPRRDAVDSPITPPPSPGS